MFGYDNNTRLMVAIFLKCLFDAKQVPTDPEKYVKKYKLLIKEACLLFEYLGLTKRDRKSPLGWKPKRRLLEIIANGGEAERERSDDAMSVNLLWDAVFGEKVLGEQGMLGLYVLSSLGLLSQDDTGIWRASSQLQRLFKENYERRL